MFKFVTIGTFDNAINIPTCKLADSVSVPVVDGMGVTVDRAKKELVLTTATTGKGDVYILYNESAVLDGLNRNAFVGGDMPLVFRAASLTGYEIAVSVDDAHFDSTKAQVQAGKLLGYGDGGKLSVISAATGYAVWFKVIEVSGGIARAEVLTALPTSA